MSDDAKRISIRKGGVVDGEQYYAISATDTFGEHSSVALPEATIVEFMSKMDAVLNGETNYAAIESGE